MFCGQQAPCLSHWVSPTSFLQPFLAPLTRRRCIQQACLPHGDPLTRVCPCLGVARALWQWTAQKKVATSLRARRAYASLHLVRVPTTAQITPLEQPRLFPNTVWLTSPRRTVATRTPQPTECAVIREILSALSNVVIRVYSRSVLLSRGWCC